jgi:hypothetical protein
LFVAGPKKCDPSYPFVCIPSKPPDLDYEDVLYSDFVVKQPDPHGFDGNSDGERCESREDQRPPGTAL